MFIVFPNGHKPVGGLEIRDEDLRIIDERTFTQMAFRDFRDFFPTDHIREAAEFSNGLARSKNNAYWYREEDAEEDDQGELRAAGDEGFNPSLVNTIKTDSLIRKSIRFKRK